jgi:magnesium chelatase subunit I
MMANNYTIYSNCFTSGNEACYNALFDYDRLIGGVLIFGDNVELESEDRCFVLWQHFYLLWKSIEGCKYHCDPLAQNLCSECQAKKSLGQKLKIKNIQAPVVDLPLGATEDRVVGALDIGKLSLRE